MLASTREFQIADPEQNTSQILEGDCRGQRFVDERFGVCSAVAVGSGISTGLVLRRRFSVYLGTDGRRLTIMKDKLGATTRSFPS
jgi:hypothetical protein